MAVDYDDFDPKSIADALRRNVEEYKPSTEREEVGRVIEAGDGIARVKGLPRAMANELLEFTGGVLGIAFNLDEDEIGCIILGESSHIEEGGLVKQTGKILSVPVGDGFLGRVVDAHYPGAKLLPRLIVGSLIADVIAIIGSIDVVMGDVDR